VAVYESVCGWREEEAAALERDATAGWIHNGPVDPGEHAPSARLLDQARHMKGRG